MIIKKRKRNEFNLNVKNDCVIDRTFISGLFKQYDNNHVIHKSIPSVSSSAVYSKPRTLDNFNDYVQFLKGKTAAEGVSLSVLNAQNNIQYMQKAVDLDRAQAGRSQRNADQPQLPNPNGYNQLSE